jgi:hypothetical protein
MDLNTTVLIGYAQFFNFLIVVYALRSDDQGTTRRDGDACHGD